MIDGGEISKAIYNYKITIEYPFSHQNNHRFRSKMAIPIILSVTQIRDAFYKSGKKPYL